MQMAAEAASTPDTQVHILKLSGTIVATVSPVPKDVLQLKQEICKRTAIPVALQNLLEMDGAKPYEDIDTLDVKQNHSMLLVTSERPMYTWDIMNNECTKHVQLEGTSILTCPQLSTDYCTVLTQEPIRSGVHYFEFVMHVIGDEQWCGVTSDPKMKGPQANPRMAKHSWTYYCGRMGYGGNLRDGMGALHAPGHAVAEFKRLRPQGDIVGMLVDMDTGALAFDLNGELQGACPIDNRSPLYCLTQPDRPGDKIELRKPSLQDDPRANLAALSGALLDITKDGKVLSTERIR
jgi:hypothetical protein